MASKLLDLFLQVHFHKRLLLKPIQTSQIQSIRLAASHLNSVFTRSHFRLTFVNCLAPPSTYVDKFVAALLQLLQTLVPNLIYVSLVNSLKRPKTHSHSRQLMRARFAMKN